MIIKSHEETKLIKAAGQEGLWKARYEGDKFRLLHAQKVDDILMNAYQAREHSDNGWTEDRSMRKIGEIPMLEFVKHPEFAYDQNAIAKWLKSPAGEPYRTVKKGI